MRDVLLVVQIAICAVLVTSSMVAVRGLDALVAQQLRLRTAERHAGDTDLTMAGYSGDRVPAMQKRMIDALERFLAWTLWDLVDQPPLAR